MLGIGKRRWGRPKGHTERYEEAQLKAALTHVRVLTGEIQRSLDNIGVPHAPPSRKGDA